jgi:hypothetical protein
MNMVDSFFRSFLVSSASNAKGCPCIGSAFSTVCDNCTKKRKMKLHLLHQRLQGEARKISISEL